MKILFVTPSAYLLGGVQDWLSQLIPDLRARGYDVTVAVPDGCQHLYAAYNELYPELESKPFNNPTGSAWGRIRCLYKLILEQLPDIVVGVNIGDIYPAAREVRRKRMFAGRIVMTIHAIEADYFNDLKYQKEVVDAVIATNRLTCSLAHSLALVPLERVFYAPYGVPIFSLKSSKYDTDKLIRVAWVGRFDQGQKRIHDLAEILKELDKCGVRYQLSLAGDGPEREWVETHLEPWLISGKVVILGRLSKVQLQRDVFASHHVLLITSNWETGPIVAWEAMAAGMAVVSSMYVGSGMEGALEHGRTALLFPVGDSQSAAQQMARLQNPKLFRLLSKAGHQLVLSRYSSQASNQAWVDALESVACLPHLPYPPVDTPLPVSGRLDRWFGVPLADNIRRTLRMGQKHSSPGGEWPHALRSTGTNDSLFFKASQLDRHG